jgi:hypothetical protein
VTVNGVEKREFGRDVVVLVSPARGDEITVVVETDS